MYKRIPATYFDSCEEVFYSMIDFMVECGFSTISIGNTSIIDLGVTTNVKDIAVMQDPNTIHKLVLILKQEDITSNKNEKNYYIAVFIIDELINGVKLYSQGNIATYYKQPTDSDFYACGACFFLYPQVGAGEWSESKLNRYDLVCIYNNKSLIFIYVPTKCYIYSHIYSYKSPLEGWATGGSILFYGNFTKYHISDITDCVMLFSSDCGSEFGIPRGGTQTSFDELYYVYGTRNILVNNYGIVYCHPEASYNIGNNCWFVYNTFTNNTSVNNHVGYNPPPLLTSFDYYPTTCRLVDYFGSFNGTVPRDKMKTESLLNNISYLQPLIVYGMREPRILENWSAIGESKLINYIGMSHISSGDVFIDTSIEEDYHKYFVFPCYSNGRDSIQYTFTGLAVEIWAKENLLKEQSDDNLTVWLNDTFRNFDRIEIVYEGNNEVEWTYDDLVAVFDTDGVFNLTKDENNKCMVYGLKNEDGESREYRFTCSESCEIISITGYRE